MVEPMPMRWKAAASSGAISFRLSLMTKGPAGAQLSHRLLTEVGKAIVPQDVHRAGGCPVPAYGEAVLIRIHVGIGAVRDAEMLTDHPRRHRHHAIGIADLGRLLVEGVQEEQPGFVFAHGRFRTAAFDRSARALGDIADEVQLIRAPFARRGIVGTTAPQPRRAPRSAC